MEKMKPEEIFILIDCEESGVICAEFRDRGFSAFSCDLQKCSGKYPEYHLQMDAIKALWSRKWDLVIAHPPCDRLANSGVRWLAERNLWEDLDKACKFFNQFVLYGKLGNKIMIENPIPHKYAIEGINNNRYHQIIQPWQFGETTTKATCLWLYNLPELKPTFIIPKEKRTQDIWLASPGPGRKKLRSKTFPGIARAMAQQWGEFLMEKHK